MLLKFQLKYLESLVANNHKLISYEIAEKTYGNLSQERIVCIFENENGVRYKVNVPSSVGRYKDNARRYRENAARKLALVAE